MHQVLCVRKRQSASMEDLDNYNIPARSKSDFFFYSSHFTYSFQCILCYRRYIHKSNWFISLGSPRRAYLLSTDDKQKYMHRFMIETALERVSII